MQYISLDSGCSYIAKYNRKAKGAQTNSKMLAIYIAKQTHTIKKKMQKMSY